MTPDELRKAVDTVVVVLMENRSFDHLFGYLGMPGYAGPAGVNALSSLQDPQYLNPSANGTMCSPYLSQDGHFVADLPHERDFVAQQMAPSGLGNQFLMNGFVAAYERFSGTTGQLRPPPLGLLTPRDIPITSFFATEFALCDSWHAPLPTSTQPNRLMALCGYSLIDSTNDGLLPGHSLVFDWLEKRGVRWRVYSEGIPFLLLMPAAWPYIAAGRFRRLDQLAHDIATEDDSTWPQVVFVEPDYEDAPIHLSGQACDNHPPIPMAFGEAFLRRVYEALTHDRAAARWNKMVCLYTYDEHGGFFDHVPPKRIPSPKPAGATYQAGGDFDSRGVRVPALIISPLVTRGGPKHELFDHTSVLQLIAERFGQNGEGFSAEVDARKQAGIQSVSAALEVPDPELPRRAPPDAPSQAISAMALLQSVREHGSRMRHSFIASIEEFAKAYAKTPTALAAVPEVAHWMGF